MYNLPNWIEIEISNLVKKHNICDTNMGMNVINLPELFFWHISKTILIIVCMSVAASRCEPAPQVSQ